MPHSHTAFTLGLGGGCHWCTEGVFSVLKGISHLEQGWLSSTPPDQEFSEGILLTFDPGVISVEDIIQIHLQTHSSQSQHSRRNQYRSAVYYQSEGELNELRAMFSRLQKPSESFITKLLPLVKFKPQGNENYKNYYLSKPEKPFCKTHIDPKIKYLIARHRKKINENKVPQGLEV